MVGNSVGAAVDRAVVRLFKVLQFQLVFSGGDRHNFPDKFNH
jgi:hypothetical protein